MRKLAVMALAGIMTLGLAACGNSNESTEAATKAATEAKTEAKTETPTEAKAETEAATEAAAAEDRKSVV